MSENSLITIDFYCFIVRRRTIMAKIQPQKTTTTTKYIEKTCHWTIIYRYNIEHERILCSILLCEKSDVDKISVANDSNVIIIYGCIFIFIKICSIKVFIWSPVQTGKML